MSSGVPAERLLDALLDATGMERAFLVTRDAAGERVRAARSRRSDGDRRPSRTAVRLALSGRRPLLFADAGSEGALARGASVRSLDLRRICTAPVPGTPAGQRRALLLDSRLGSARAGGEGPPAPELAASLGAFAVLAALHTRGAPEANTPATSVDPGAEASDLVGRSSAFREMLAWARRSAPFRFPVLILGESGTGKERIARALHRWGPRRSGPFVPVNCAALPEALVESELFGAVRGAFTGSDRDRAGLFRRATGGTLFLDEVGELALPAQAKLLRVLEDERVRPVGGEREFPVDLRILAATHRDLAAAVAAGRFREDLYHRMAMLEIRIPPLRRRPGDLPLLCAHLIDEIHRSTGLPRAAPTAEVVRELQRRRWPGNVRELRAVLLRALLRAGGDPIVPGHLDPPRDPPAGAGAAEPVAAAGRSLESAMIDDALVASAGNLTRAAARIGWTRQKLYRRMAALSIPRPQRRE